MSLEILSIFRTRGGDFCTIQKPSIYEYNFHLIDSFYNNFKEYIKVASISKTLSEEDINNYCADLRKKGYRVLVRVYFGKGDFLITLRHLSDLIRV